MLTKGCFVGIEAEGPEQGVKTLFIADPKANPEKIKEFILSEKSVTHVYFGAGQTYGVSDYHIPLLSFLISIGRTVIVEVDTPSKLINIHDFQEVTIVLAVKSEEVYLLQFNNVRIKIEDKDNVIVFSNSNINHNYILDPLYDQDKGVDI